MKHARQDRLGVALLVALGLALPTAAYANGAMSLALATFGWDMWLPYVVVTLVFEAVILGRWLRVPLRRALNIAFGANFVTAIIGGFFSGILSYIFYDSFGSKLNPNPFFQNLLLFTLFGIVSACIEALFWAHAVEKPIPLETTADKPARSRPRSVLAQVLLVHLLGVPVGLAVLLLPARPYPGLEGRVYGERYRLERQVQRALEHCISQNRRVPSVQNYEELLELLKTDLDRFGHDSGRWAGAYRPHYERFDTGEMRREPITWNRDAAGRRLSDDLNTVLWLTRSQYHGYCRGLVLTSGYSVKITTDRTELGYTDMATTRR
jgi:hypothetical protein